MIHFLKALLGLGSEGVGPREAVSRMNAGALLVDVREPFEFASAHAPQAHPVPLGQIRTRGIAALEALIPPDGCSEVLLICQSGMRSRIAQSALTRDTRRRYVNVNGGMAAWRAAGLPCRSEARR